MNPVDATGQPIMYVDVKGKPVPMEEYHKRMQRMHEEARRTKRFTGMPKDLRHIQSMQIGSHRKGETRMLMDIDPKLVSKVRLSGHHTRTVEIGGIPLDPR